jgi:exopolysaccharide biosynthesis polyprenyl glycosylphosphotransferase
MAQRPWAGYQVVHEIPRPISSDNWGSWFEGLTNVLKSFDIKALALAESSASDANFIRELSWRLEGESVDLLLSAGGGTTTGPRLSLRIAPGLPLLHLDEVALRDTQRVAKRILDVAGSLIGILLLAPVLLAISLTILLSSGRPVFFRQLRVGRDHRVFRMWKFRTMVLGADKQRDALRAMSKTGGPIFKLNDDPRISASGHFLRRWSLDELPQLFNVLSGKMSLVGPRPHPLDDVSFYAEQDLRRLIAKPGMTGLWQVAGRSDLTWAASIELDLLYIENWTLIGDLAIIARTFQAVIQGSGAR